MDKRIIKTKQKIKKSILNVYKSGYPLENYPIKYLCNDVKMNRTTFYIHYSCIEDVLEDIGFDLIKELYDIVEANLNDINDCTKKIVEHIKDNAIVYKMILNESKLKWVNNTIDIYRNLLNKSKLVTNIADQNAREFTINFVVYGSYGILSTWVNNDCLEERSVVIERLLRFINE